MTSINKEQFWQNHISAWQSSGLSQAQYCQQHEIKFHNFAYWRTRLNQAAKPAAKLLKLGGLSVSSRVVMSLPQGIRLELSASDLLAVLPVVLHTLRDAP